MRYILDNEGYIESIAFGSYIECSNKSCTEYTGSIPTGYNSLCEWADNANIQAYYLVNGNLTYDSDKAEELQRKWKEESQNNVPGEIIEGIIISGSNENGNYIKYADGTMASLTEKYPVGLNEDALK